MRITDIERLLRNGNTGRFRVRVLREVEGQHQRFTSRVLDFHAAVRKCGLSDKSDLGIDLAENHILVMAHFELSNAAASTIRMEQRGTLRAETGLAARSHGETENRALLVAEEIAVNNPLCVYSVACEFLGGDCRTRVLQNKVRGLFCFEVELFNQVLPVFVPVLRIVLFAAGVKRIRCSDTSVERTFQGGPASSCASSASPGGLHSSWGSV